MFDFTEGLDPAAKAQAALEGLYLRDSAYGVPTIIVTVPDNRAKHQRCLEETELLVASDFLPITKSDKVLVIQRLRDAFNARAKDFPVLTPLIIFDGGFLHETKDCVVRKSNSGLLLVPEKVTDPKLYLKKIAWFSPNWLKPLPGTPEHWQYFVTASALAKIGGAGAPQGSHIATLEYRKTFGDDNVPRALADIFAITALRLGAVKNNFWANYEAINAACALPQKDIDAMTEKQIFATAYKPFSRNENAFTYLVDKLKKSNPILFQESDRPLAYDPFLIYNGLIDIDDTIKSQDAERVSTIYREAFRRVMDYREINPHPSAPQP